MISIIVSNQGIIGVVVVVILVQEKIPYFGLSSKGNDSNNKARDIYSLSAFSSLSSLLLVVITEVSSLSAVI